MAWRRVACAGRGAGQGGFDFAFMALGPILPPLAVTVNPAPLAHNLGPGMRDIVLIHVSGADRPGLLSLFTSTLADYGVDVLDIGQSVIHQSLSLGLLVRLPAQAAAAQVLKDVLFLAHEQGVGLTFTPVDDARYAEWVASQGRPRHIITMVARTITAAQVAAVAQVLADNDLNVDFVHRLSGREPLVRVAQEDTPQERQADCPPVCTSRQACVELSVRGTAKDPQALRKAFLAISAAEGVDIAFQGDDVYRRNRRLVVFDMDSTLIAAEVIDELAVEAGVGDEVKAVTEAAMRGELDFRESLRRRVALLKGLSVERLDVVSARIPLTEGAERLVHNLRRLGLKTAIISGGFTFFGERLKGRLGIDYLFANRLEIRDGQLTGRVEGEVVDATRKAELLRAIAKREGIDLRQVIAVGDGANDLPMLGLAGLGIAFHAKPVVKEGAGHAISNLGLDAILYLLGLRDRDIEA